MNELRERDQFILTFISKMKNAVLGGGGVASFFVFKGRGFFVIKILSVYLIAFVLELFEYKIV